MTDEYGEIELSIKNEDKRKMYEHEWLERCEDTADAVSYTHLTLPTTPYV